MFCALRSEAHTETNQDLVAGDVHIVVAAGEREGLAAEIGVAVLKPREGLIRHLHIDTGASRPTPKGLVVRRGSIGELVTSARTTGRAIDEHIVSGREAETRADRAVDTALSGEAGIVAIHTVVADIAFNAV